MNRLHTLSQSTRRLIRRVIIAILAVLCIECAWFNLPYFVSISASGDSSSVMNELGSGLHRTDDGMVEVTDPTQAYFMTTSDDTSPYWWAQPVSKSQLQAAQSAPWSAHIATTVHLRLVSHGKSSAEQSVSESAPRSLYMRYVTQGTTYIWVMEAKGTRIPIENIRANVRVPFSFNWARVATMLTLALLIMVFLPRSWLWRTSLDVHNRTQRLLFVAVWIPLIIAVGWQIIWKIRTATPIVFHTPGGYTYDFDQYGHIADSLLQGRLYLDLPVSPALAQATDPYDIAQRNQLLAQGTSPIYWDYALYNGHWYSYFGVLPALLLFVPFRVISSWFVPGGMMLPAACAELFLMLGVCITGCLLVIRVLQRTRYQYSLGAVVVSCIAYMLGANMPYLWFRTNFYSIPFAAALLLAQWGLWLWLGAFRDNGSLRLTHIAGGALCIAATFGCRPTFALTALFAFPLFAPTLLAWWRAHHTRPILSFLLALIFPALLVVIPLVLYNWLRFGALLDFGNAYQITVANMTTFHTPLQNMPQTVWYYLFLPLHVSSTFPFIEISATPLPSWSFTEPCIGGLCAIMPLTLLAAATPWLRTRLGRAWTLCSTADVLAVVLLLFDAFVGGFGWRYMADFGWLFMIAAIPVAAFLMHCLPSTRALITIIVFLALLIALLSCFTIGREDMLIRNDPALYHTVRAWFTLLS